METLHASGNSAGPPLRALQHYNSLGLLGLESLGLSVSPTCDDVPLPSAFFPPYIVNQVFLLVLKSQSSPHPHPPCRHDPQVSLLSTNAQLEQADGSIVNVVPRGVAVLCGGTAEKAKESIERLFEHMRRLLELLRET
eukprot:scaffold8732_cov133-Isochrysis_galbana.AAC.8